MADLGVFVEVGAIERSDHGCQQIVDLALASPEESPRQLAYRFINEKGYYVSESSVYRLLKHYDLIQ